MLYMSFASNAEKNHPKKLKRRKKTKDTRETEEGARKGKYIRQTLTR